jgi:hypothetical protein
VALKRGGSLENATDLLFSGMLDAVLEDNPDEASLTSTKGFFMEFVAFLKQQLANFPVDTPIIAATDASSEGSKRLVAEYKFLKNLNGANGAEVEFQNENIYIWNVFIDPVKFDMGPDLVQDFEGLMRG